MVVERLSVAELDHTPLFWEYCPLVMVALEGAHRALETKASWNVMPLPSRRERVFGMYLRSSFRISSARMKTMLGLAVSASAWVGMLAERPKESSTTNVTEANGRLIFLISRTPLERAE